MSVFERAGGERCEGSQTPHEELERRLSKAADGWERPRRRLAQSIGQYKEDSGVVLLIKIKGKMIQTMGFMWNGQKHLQMEEAMFLVDQGYLLLTHGPESASMMFLSVQECLELMVASGVSLERYLIYADLKSNGHVTFRHPLKLSLTKDEHPHDIWESWNPKATANNRPSVLYEVFGTASGFSRSRLKSPERCIVHVPGQQLSCSDLAEIESSVSVPCVYAFEMHTEVVYYTLDSIQSLNSMSPKNDD